MPIDPRAFLDELESLNMDFYTGVPDSLLKNLCACIADRIPSKRHVIAANEGAAVAAACGYHVATGRTGVVYLQNSGLGNAVNPLLSLADAEVYSVPLLMIIGWRGEPGVHDEPQHVKQGKVTTSLLEALGIGYDVLDDERWEQQLAEAVACMGADSVPYALVVRKGTFGGCPFEPADNGFPMMREQALESVLGAIPSDDFVVSTTGKTSREVFEIREARGAGHAQDFLTVGSMGHASSIAFGMSLGSQKGVWCIDGDGAMIMHMGTLPVAVCAAGDNFKYIVNVNGAHESVGGQLTAAMNFDVSGVLRACGFSVVEEVRSEDGISGAVAALAAADGPAALVLYTRQGSRSDLGRPTISPVENKKAIMGAFRLACA